MSDSFIDYKVSHTLIPLKIENKGKYIRDLRNIEYSWTGRIDAQIANTFILESAQLIVNAVELFERGYFDCAYYSLRQSLEVSTTMAYITELSHELREEKLADWKRESDFPMYSQMMRFLCDNENVFADMRELMSDYFTDLKGISKKLNKYVHKQGFKYFYISRSHPLSLHKNHDFEVEEFEVYLKKCIGSIAVIRLAVDPMPILLMDEEIYFRTNATMTMPYTEEFIDDYIGIKHIQNYKKTQVYINHYNCIIQEERKLPCVADVVKHEYIDKSKIYEILSQKHLLHKIDYIAVTLANSSDKISKVYCYDGMKMYFTNINTVRTKLSWSGFDFKSFRENQHKFNIIYDEAFISVFLIDEEIFYVEHNEELNSDEINQINQINGLSN